MSTSTTNDLRDFEPLRVVSAAAGSGKTTRLVQVYLDLLRDGLVPSRIIAITFTRKAAAALVEKVSLCLRRAADPHNGPVLHDFDACFAEHVPTDPKVIARASKELMNAPVGTTDAFVSALLNEFALNAALPLDTGGAAPLDLPILPADASAVFEAAARQVIDPCGQIVPEDAKVLLGSMNLGELLQLVSSLARENPRKLVSETALAARLTAAAIPILRSACLSKQRVGVSDTNGTRPFKDVVDPWLANGAYGTPPWQVLPWLAARITGAAYLKPLVDGLAAEQIDFGTTSLSLLDLVACAHSSSDLRSALNDRLRAALLRLARATRAVALPLAAETRQLDYDLLTDAAIALCESPVPRLRGRFDALLVDEVQDANPRQERLYQALEALPGDGRTLRTFYVGDIRQSIYLFRGAEPLVFQRLIQRAEDATSLSELETNYRSAPSLVAAQRGLFEAASASLLGLRTVEHIQPHLANVDLEPAAEGEELAPVVFVTQPFGQKAWSVLAGNNTGLDVFVERLVARWKNEQLPGARAETAVVLTQSWFDALRARDRLRGLMRHHGLPGEDVVIDGNRNLNESRVCKDVCILLRALWRREDGIAWLGLWKHPMIGLSDGAIGALGSLEAAAGYPVSLSNACWEEALPERFTAVDRATFARVREPLRTALSDIGRRPTAQVLEALTSALRWRPIIAAGPDGDDGVAELEVTLDWIRSLEADGVDPDAVIEVLEAGATDDAPRLQLERGAGVIVCTTIFQSKGLEYDHVFVYSIGKSYGGGAGAWPSTPVRLDGDPEESLLLGANVDPHGGLDVESSFLSQVAGAVAAKRSLEERLRLAYVAITRARRTVTFTLMPKAALSGIHEALATAWLDALPMEGVSVVERDGPLDVVAAQPGYARATGVFPTQAGVTSSSRWIPPSSAALGWTASRLNEWVDEAASTASLVAGQARIDPPALTGDVLAHEWQWGELVHGWLAASALSATPTTAEALAYLLAAWRLEEEAVAHWLVSLNLSLHQRRPELMAELLGPDSVLHFECPFIAQGHTDQVAHGGRLDLFVERPNKRAWILDFKAGLHAPTSQEDLVRGANLRTYGPQLVAYQHAAERSGWVVERLGLLFVRTGATVMLSV